MYKLKTNLNVIKTGMGELIPRALCKMYVKRMYVKISVLIWVIQNQRFDIKKNVYSKKFWYFQNWPLNSS